MDINKIKERFLYEYGPDTDQMVSAHQSFMPNEVCEWWLSKLQQRDAEIKNTLVEKIKRNDGCLHSGDVDHIINLIKSNE